MAAAARREFDCVLVWKIDRLGRSVLNLSQQLAALTSYPVRFIAVSQALDTHASNPSSRLMLTILAGVAEFEREIIRERTLAGVRAAKAAGKTLGRPRRVFRRDEAMRMRAEGQSWRAIAAALNVPLSTLHGVFGKSPRKGPESTKQPKTSAESGFPNDSENTSGAAAVSTPKLIFSGAQMAFGDQDGDVRLAFQRLGKALEPLGVSYQDVVFSNIYPLTRAQRVRYAPLRLRALATSVRPACDLQTVNYFGMLQQQTGSGSVQLLRNSDCGPGLKKV
jgi:hypothetical protein